MNTKLPHPPYPRYPLSAASGVYSYKVTQSSVWQGREEEGGGEVKNNKCEIFYRMQTENGDRCFLGKLIYFRIFILRRHY